MNNGHIVPKIDEEFESLIPPLTKEEFEQLRANILEDNEVHSPLILWNGTLLDGHNRWKIIRENSGISYTTKEMIFLSREDAIEWICKNQLGRRNLTNDQKRDLIGRMQRARKKTQGTNNQYVQAKSEKVQNEPFHLDTPKSTAAQIAKEMGVSESYVKRAEKFTDGVDAIREVNPAAAEKVLLGKSGKTQAQISDAAKMEPEKRREFVESIVNPPALEQKPEPRKYDIDMLVSDVNNATETYIRFARDTLAKHNDCYEDATDGERVLYAFESAIKRIQEIQKLINGRTYVQQNRNN